RSDPRLRLTLFLLPGKCKHFFFSLVLMGHRTADSDGRTVIFKSLPPLSLPCSHVFSLERVYILAGCRREAVVASKFHPYHLRLTC
uniref:Uncharacterized protein n=1 Tax=Salarias fasciatus TaxID=181472 RepID=A0A672JDA5_SALFA